MADFATNFIAFLIAAAYWALGIAIMFLLFRLLERFTDWLIARRIARLKPAGPDYISNVLVIYRTIINAAKWLVIAAGVLILVALAIHAFTDHP
jgi:membrane-associated PAP2 superfamily phosphatase